MIQKRKGDLYEYYGKCSACRKKGNREGGCRHRNRADSDVDCVWSAACFHAAEGTV